MTTPQEPKPTSLSKDTGAEEPSREPESTPPPGEWWQPSDAPAGPLGGQSQPSGSGPAGPPSSQPSSGGGPAGPFTDQPIGDSGPANPQPSWGSPQGAGQPWDAPPSGGQQPWAAEPYPQYPGGGQPQDSTGGPPQYPQPQSPQQQYPQGGIYNYPQTGGPGTYGEYPQQTYQPYATPQRSGSQVFSIIGFVCAVVSILFCPILFGPAGVILGIIGHTKGEPLGKWAAIAAGVCMIIGLLVGFLLFSGDLRT